MPSSSATRSGWACACAATCPPCGAVRTRARSRWSGWWTWGTTCTRSAWRPACGFERSLKAVLAVDDHDRAEEGQQGVPGVSEEGASVKLTELLEQRHDQRASRVQVAKLDADVDLWVQAPNDTPVGYSNKGGDFFNLTPPRITSAPIARSVSHWRPSL